MSVISFNSSAQNRSKPEARKTVSFSKYGSTLNMGIGIGYFGVRGHLTPVVNSLKTKSSSNSDTTQTGSMVINKDLNSVFSPNIKQIR